MEPLQKQILALDKKVDSLYKITEQLSIKVAEILAEIKPLTHQGNSRSTLGSVADQGTHQPYSLLHAGLEHKDVLTDANVRDGEEQNGERELAPEIQVRRLTAQVTAAYNRIAALEEQLLSKRIHDKVIH